MKSVFVIVLFFLSCVKPIIAQVPDSLKFKSLLPYDFHLQYLKDDNSILIDVREFFEFRKSRIKGAVNIPTSGNFKIAADTIEKDKSLFFYCFSGTRSKRAALFFYDKGFRKLYSLNGGITLWKKEKMAVDRKRIKRK